jgi:putative colanic acid biosynthesis acetyltransferase WcaF
MDFTPTQTTPFSLKTKIKIRGWKFINKTFFRYSPFFARKYRIALVRLFGADVSWTCSLDRTTVIDLPWNLKIGNLSSTGEGCWIYCLDKITIGENTCIGKNVFLLTGSHDVNSKHFNLVTSPILIGSGVWVSTGSYILPGITIGNYAVVAAGSVVVKTVEPWSIVGGNPAKFIKKREITD